MCKNTEPRVKSLDSCKTPDAGLWVREFLQNISRFLIIWRQLVCTLNCLKRFVTEAGFDASKGYRSLGQDPGVHQWEGEWIDKRDAN